MLTTIYDRLALKGWAVTQVNDTWLIARHHARAHAIYCITMATDIPQPLNPPVANQELAQVHTLVLCPHGVNPAHLNQKHKKGVQYWFWDLRNGHVFPFPPTQTNEIHWLLACIADSESEAPETDHPSSEQELGKSRHNPLITYVILAINIILFGVMTLAGGTQDPLVLIRFGAKVNPLIQEGQIWRLVTCNFIHIGIVHLAFNCYALWVLGRYCENLFGTLRYAVIYLTSGVTGSLMSYLLSPSISAGASAAIFGILGALLIYSLNKPELLRSGVTGNLIAVIIANFALGFMLTGIDNYAHLGGLVTGIILGLFLFGIKQPLLKKYVK